MCNQAPDTVYGTIIQDKINHDLDLAQAVGRIVYSTQAIVEKAADQVCLGRGRGWWCLQFLSWSNCGAFALSARAEGADNNDGGQWTVGGCLHAAAVWRATAPPQAANSRACCAPLQYPFGGLPNFPEAYPILLSGSAQSNTSVGQSVTGG